MKYIYRNTSGKIQTVTLVNKEQTDVTTYTFTPNASLILDYQGLNLYVPNILSVMAIDHDGDGAVISKSDVEVAVTPEVIPPVVKEEVKIEEPKVEKIEDPAQTDSTQEASTGEATGTEIKTAELAPPPPAEAAKIVDPAPLKVAKPAKSKEKK
jgi:hypothetical protein